MLDDGGGVFGRAKTRAAVMLFFFFSFARLACFVACSGVGMDPVEIPPLLSYGR